MEIIASRTPRICRTITGWFYGHRLQTLSILTEPHPPSIMRKINELASFSSDWWASRMFVVGRWSIRSQHQYHNMDHVIYPTDWHAISPNGWSRHWRPQKDNYQLLWATITNSSTKVVYKTGSSLVSKVSIREWMSLQQLYEQSTHWLTYFLHCIRSCGSVSVSPSIPYTIKY